jgi:hypothetical protein
MKISPVANKGKKGMSVTKEGESGIEELRRVAGVSERCREGAIDRYSAEECLNLFRACWRSVWDLYPDELTDEERDYAAKHGVLSEKCLIRLSNELG